jgi:hypothetical protein
MADYSSDIAFVQEVLAEDGGLGSIEIPVGSVADASKSWRVADTTPITYPIHMLVLEIEAQQSAAQHSQLVRAYLALGDLVGIVPAGFEVSSGMILNDPGGHKWEIEQVKILRPDGVSQILAVCHISRLATDKVS